ncbi:TetR/AcrR family transcriptional regulator [Ottowia thiooxydans]|uniref:TetR/AcrR family transcriptional regulator n=1 Tax=Ottowia thiooxydans TaxID=219182 RepID=UPI0004247E25|nr:TetR/AcrR family transcriptional regulator [Ottowia thiooxydans]
MALTETSDTSGTRAPTGKKPSKAPSNARDERQKALVDVRRALVLDAARKVFFERGLEGTSIREIAQQAGYTPGAIYSYFTSKEEVYGALLGESLERLNERVTVAASKSSRTAAKTTRAAAEAFFDFYRENPRDLDLGFYLFQGMQPRGLTPALNETLNKRLRDSLQPIQQGLEALGLSPEKALAEVTALFAYAVGLLVLSHTGRIRMFKQESRELYRVYLDRLLNLNSA